MPHFFRTLFAFIVLLVTLNGCTPSDTPTRPAPAPTSTPIVVASSMTASTAESPPSAHVDFTPPEEQLHAINAELRKKFVTARFVQHNIVDDTQLLLEFTVSNNGDHPITALGGVIRLETKDHDILFLHKNFEYEGAPIQPKETRKITQKYDVLYVKRLDLLPDLKAEELAFSFEPDKIQF